MVRFSDDEDEEGIRFSNAKRSDRVWVKDQTIRKQLGPDSQVAKEIHARTHSPITTQLKIAEKANLKFDKSIWEEAIKNCVRCAGKVSESSRTSKVPVKIERIHEVPMLPQTAWSLDFTTVPAVDNMTKILVARDLTSDYIMATGVENEQSSTIIKWLKIWTMCNNTSICPAILVDNAPQLKSAELKKFLREKGSYLITFEALTSANPVERWTKQVRSA